MTRHRHLRGHTGTPTVPDRTDTRHRHDLMTGEAFERTAFYRAFDRFTCPTCQAPPGGECVTRNGDLYGAGNRNHKPREALLQSQPCPTCHAGTGEYCTGREAGINHSARDEAIHRATPGSEYTPPRPTVSPALAAERRRRALAAIASTHPRPRRQEDTDA
jgi:hypothetical protein